MEKIEVTHVLDFLSAMFDKGHAYSTSKSAKCAMATIVHITSYDSLNKHPLTNKYMTDIFILIPPKPKLRFVWDVDIFFRYFEQQSEVILKQKLTVLLLLLGGHRLNTIKLFNINNMVLNDLSVTFLPTEVLKHFINDNPLETFEHRAYEDKTLLLWHV